MNAKKDRQRGNADGERMVHMKNHRQYSTFDKERKVFAIVMTVILILMVALAVLTLTGEFDKEEYQHQVEFPIANTNISWSQTFYSGPWSDAT